MGLDFLNGALVMDARKVPRDEPEEGAEQKAFAHDLEGSDLMQRDDEPEGQEEFLLLGLMAKPALSDESGGPPSENF